MKTKPIWPVLLVVTWPLLAVPAAADGSCDTPGNLTHNCNFDRFVDQSADGSTRIVPEGWTFWVTMGSPAFDIDDHGSAPGSPAQRIWSDGGPWTAGLYQQVQVVQGKGYRARIVWAAPNAPDIERRVGIDPLGGTDPMSPRVVWGPSSWEQVRMPDLQVSASAQAPTITVFVWTHHPQSHGADQVFLDAVTLVEDPSVGPPSPMPSPTKANPTRRPPTRTPAPASATSTPTAMPASPTPTWTSSPTFTPTATATQTPTASPTPTWTLTPSPAPPTLTPLPSRTALPTVVVEAQIARVSETASSPAMDRAIGQEGTSGMGLLYVALGALLSGIILAGLVLWLWSRGRSIADQQDDPLPEE